MPLPVCTFAILQQIDVKSRINYHFLASMYGLLLNSLKLLYFFTTFGCNSKMVKELKEPQKYFAAALRHLVQQQWGLQTKLAKELGISQQSISKLASGKMEGKEADRRRIAAILGYSYEDFLQFGCVLIDNADSDTAPNGGIATLSKQVDFLLNEASAEEVNFLKFTTDNLYQLVKSRNSKHNEA